MTKCIEIRGTREHNPKDVSLRGTRGAEIVFTWLRTDLLTFARSLTGQYLRRHA